ncbi:NERD domain-containing protein [Anabaena sphaerica]|uniref:NERD domain-containing protein n=1 Tax=Anabaena sphaerica TaxID=212446 RepID=UPI0018EFA0DE
MQFYNFTINPQGKTPGKELYDVLIVCDPHVIVISVKDIQLKNTDDPSVDWKRWQRKAIEDSIKQIRGAIRWLEQAEYVVQKDGSQGLKLPLMSTRIYHRVAVAFGKSELLARCFASLCQFNECFTVIGMLIVYIRKHNFINL